MTVQNEAIVDTDSTSKAPEVVVDAFFKACSTLDIDAGLALIDEHCVYKNVPFHTAKGKRRIERDLRAMTKSVNQFDVDTVNMAVNGNVVMTERIDTLSGRFFSAAIPLMGVFVVENGKITEWRDYFDWSSVLGKFGRSLLTSPFRR